MKASIIRLLALLTVLWTAGACTDDYPGSNGQADGQGQRITLSGETEQVAVTRVNDSGFCDGDEIGVYIVDYQGNNPGDLQTNGNRGTNVRHTFDEAGNQWESAYDIYWKDGQTHIDVYGYYPYGSPEDVNAYAFEVQKDQSTESTSNGMGGYEASDFLWGKAANVAPTENTIRLPMYHRMSSPRVTLVEGEGFSSGEWATLEKSVLVRNIRTGALINLADGSVAATGEVSPTGIIPYVKDNVFRVIIVPQTISAGTVLFTITVDGTVYNFSREEAFTYVSGKMHNFTIQVDKRVETGDYTFTLAGESITAWENDDVSHDATMREYIVIESSAGKLKEAITAAGKDFRKLQNLKITGEINAQDFYFMRDSMDVLQSLNLKEVIIRGGTQKLTGGQQGDYPHNDYEMPYEAMRYKSSLLNLVLPDKLTKIGIAAFADCQNLTGTLNIPEGVTEIEYGAFYQCKNMTGSLSLPTTLKYIGRGEDRWWYGGTFSSCGFTCQLIFSAEVECILGNAFENCQNLYGELRLPDKLTQLGDAAFRNCRNLSGNLTIPQGVTAIPNNAFEDCGNLDGTLMLHDGISTIGEYAFRGTHFKGEINLPKDLTVLSNYVFSGCDFSGELKLPEKLRTIGNNAFGSYEDGSCWRMMGTLEFPQDIISIGQGAFYGCRSIEGVVFPESLESIQNEAFYMCTGIGSIVCKGSIPAYTQASAFDGVPKDNFTLEVPESTIQQYQAAVGWSDFKRIAAHRELVCRPSIANAINTRCTRDLVIDAEGEWEVESMPDWCSLSQTSGNKKTELVLAIDQMSGETSRTGEIVFKLKDQDYRHTCTVSQYNYEYAEDEVITLQKATRGNRGGINLVFLGDGYDAKDISEGKYMQNIQEQVENFFGIEPYKTYRDYFNVYTAIAVSPESGIGTVNTIRYAKFETTYTGGVGLRCDYDAAFQYAIDMGTTVTRDNLNQSLLIMIPNSTDYGGICQMYDDGSAIAFCPLSTYGYPLDTRGVIQHEAGGHGFGKLGDEYIYHNEFIDFCGCTCCGHVFEFNYAKGLGWYENLSLSGKTNEVPWSQLIYDEKYSDFVDIFEGGYMHSRGVFRSEQNSCMNNDIPYYSTISRMAIVKRIKEYAGETFTYEDFKAHDVVSNEATTRSFIDLPYSGSRIHTFQHPPRIVKGSPLSSK